MQKAIPEVCNVTVLSKNVSENLLTAGVELKNTNNLILNHQENLKEVY